MKRLLKRLMVIGLLGISLVAFLRAEAKAGSVTINGVTYYFKSIDCDAFGGGLGRKDVAFVTCDVLIKDAVFRCENGGGNDGGLGQAFDVNVSVGGSASAQADASGKGKWFSEVTISTAQLEAALVAAGVFTSENCQNLNWTPIPGTTVVTKFVGTATTFACTTADCTSFTQKDQETDTCTLPADAVLGDQYVCTPGTI